VGRAVQVCQFRKVQRLTKLRRRKPIVRAMNIVVGEKVRRVKEKGRENCSIIPGT
jgi:hypothetical protein